MYTWPTRSTPPWSSLLWPLPCSPPHLLQHICRPAQGIVAQFHPCRLKLQSGIHSVLSFSFAWWNSCCVCCWSSISFSKYINSPPIMVHLLGTRTPPFQYQRMAPEISIFIGLLVVWLCSYFTHMYFSNSPLVKSASINILRWVALVAIWCGIVHLQQICA